jgi:hypothetical protein
VRSGRWIVRAVGIFATAYVLAFAWNQRFLPVMSNDALTYHFPAAVHWLQTGCLRVFQVWFFNPANTFSPLGGSTFIAWLMAPMRNDLLARFVELPALLFVGIGTYQICRQLRVEAGTAALVAAAVILSRPLFFQSLMGKDDLFVTAFFICALLAMLPARIEEPMGAVRLGIALGLLLAMKYTAWFSAPILLLAIHSGWKIKRLGTAVVVAGLLAGPWYARNIWLTGNPFFPVSIPHLFHGLFTTAPSERLRGLGNVWGVLSGGSYGLPVGLFVVIGCGCMAMWIGHLRESLRDPLVRTCVIGPIVGLALFVWKSPFAEVRFVFPTFVLLFACLAGAIDFVVRPLAIRRIVAFLIVALSVGTQFVPSLRASVLGIVVPAITAAIGGVVLLWITSKQKVIGMLVYAVTALVLLALVYVYWDGYVAGYEASRLSAESGWAKKYPYETALWKYVDENIPSDAVLAYTNTYLIYPLEGFSMRRRLVYAPTRPGVQSQADLPWLGNGISGEDLVAATTLATLGDAQRDTWLANLRKSGAGYLFIARGDVVNAPPEAGFAAGDPKRFIKLMENEAGVIYRIVIISS